LRKKAAATIYRVEKKYRFGEKAGKWLQQKPFAVKEDSF
jgi:hypothetical protein